MSKTSKKNTEPVSAHGYTKPDGYSRNVLMVDSPEAKAQGQIVPGKYTENASVANEDGFKNAARRAASVEQNRKVSAQDFADHKPTVAGTRARLGHAEKVAATKKRLGR